MSSAAAMASSSLPPSAVLYPDSDGQPMAENTEQFAFIQTFQGNLDVLLPDFVAGDHLWYPVEGRPDLRIAPDVYVAMGRPKGHRGSYKQWLEADAPLSVVFEWWSPSNTFGDRVQKLRFYERFGVQEFYAWDPLTRELSAFHREGQQLIPVNTEGGIISPLLGVRLDVQDGALRGWRPDGKPFLTVVEMDEARQRAELERDQAARERDQAARERDQAARERDQERARAEALAAKLRELGVELD